MPRFLLLVLASMNQHCSYKGIELMEQVLPPTNTIASFILKNAHCQLNQVKGIKQRFWPLGSVRCVMVETCGKEGSCYVPSKWPSLCHADESTCVQHAEVFLVGFIWHLWCISAFGPGIVVFP